MKYLLPALGLFLLPYTTFAHTRWFAGNDLPLLPPSEPTALYLGIWAFIALVIVSVGTYLHQHDLFRLPFLRPKQSYAYERAASTFTMAVGSFFLIAGTHEYLFSPNFTHSAGIPYALIVIQIVIGLAFLLGIGSRVAALALGALYLCSLGYVGAVTWIENIWVLSTAMFIAITGNDYFSLVSVRFLQRYLAPYKGYALSLLRLGTGATLFILGFSEKILAPEYGLNFLQFYHWNFMAALGVPFSDYLFTLSAGSVEALFGLVFMLGIVTRLNALVVAIVFTIPLFILGPIELAGHMPHFAAVVLLLLFGNGGHFMFVRSYKDERVAASKQHA